MATKANKIREQARKRRNAACAIPDKQQLKESNTLKGRDILLSAEAKALLEEMREHGFAPPRGLPTVKQFSRYAAYRNSRAASNRAAALDEETAVYMANGGLMQAIFDRLGKPTLKDTAFANLSTAALRVLNMAPSLVDADQRISIASDSNIVEDDELARVAKEFGVDL
ncbi:hypothetical protein [Lelliottia wanjuensis]|uniref:hypothetical protein n=1 Tax=Lelliottia wanjuensis TaxID=3050585 RepID=UPI00254B6C7A|nr:hypothetical protein [Lelliottia sp. V86_10]MDK9586739.1 hypothetical protein [Lelliottia sp. V86_10]